MSMFLGGTIGNVPMDRDNIDRLTTQDPKTMSADDEKQLETLQRLCDVKGIGGINIFSPFIGNDNGLAAKIKGMIDTYHATHPDTQQA
ncbi:hypothetical protein [Mycetohabitans rhizoxinica]|uniref:hypothetical protein n=1 Tax=Mycetohabitans rhizoxinica TaxID=412963 RepID=UPI0030CB86A7